MKEPLRIILYRCALSVVFLLLFAFAAARAPQAEPILIEPGTVAPAGSIRHQSLHGPTAGVAR